MPRRPATADPGRLRRRLGVNDPVVIGLGSMIGAGIFAALAPAAVLALGAVAYGVRPGGSGRPRR